MRRALALPILLGGCIQTAATFAIIEGAHHDESVKFLDRIEAAWQKRKK